MTLLAAWSQFELLLEDERLEFMHEPLSIEPCIASFLKLPIASSKLVTDAYLASFAISSGIGLVSLDRGFRRFKGLDLTLLGENTN